MYVVGGKFWNIETAAVWRESMTDPDTLPNEVEMEDVEDVEAETKESSPYLSSPPKFEKYYTLDSKLRAGKHATGMRPRFSMKKRIIPVSPPFFLLRN